jgi:hypothetical protein
MKIERTDIYARIHKGLRKALFEFSEKTGTTNPSNIGEIKALIELGNKVFAFLELHAEIEERFQLPLLDQQDTDYAKQDHNEHLLLEQIIDCLKVELASLLQPDTLENKWYNFYLHLNEFIGNYLVHMHHEETVTAELFIDHCQPSEMQAVIGKINAYTTPDQKELAMGYFIPAISLPERVEFLMGIRRSSRQAYEAMLARTEYFLDSTEWDSLQQALASAELPQIK